MYQAVKSPLGMKVVRVVEGEEFHVVSFTDYDSRRAREAAEDYAGWANRQAAA